MSSLRPFAVCLLSVFLVATAKSQAGCYVSTIGSPLILFPPKLGAPFSADIVKEQTLLSKDGTEHVQVSHGRIYRDGEGRSRCEIEDAKGQITVIDIVDPVAHLYIRLLSRDKVARVMHKPEKAPSTPAAPTPAPEVTHVGFEPLMEDLGSRTIEGVVATGQRLTKTQEARDAEQASGHVMAVDMSESWFSKDLQLKLLEVTDYSHSSKVVHKALNIQRGNPDPQVFHIPDGYTVKDIYCRGARCDYDSPEPASPQAPVKSDR
jgi:hypothetical protein